KLLFKTQLLALDLLVVGIENLGDVFGVDLVPDRGEEVTGVEAFNVERLDGLCGPEAHGVRGVGAVAEDGRIVGNSTNQLFRIPADVETAISVAVPFGMAAEFDFDSVFGALQCPGIAEAEPFVSGLHVAAVVDLLVEDAVLVADAIADGRNVECGKGIHEARGETAQAAVAKARLGFLLDERFEIEAELAHGLLGFVVDAEVDEIVGKVRPGEEFSRKVADDTDVLCAVIEDGLNPTLD